jgi:SAV_6107-like HEPN
MTAGRSLPAGSPRPGLSNSARSVLAQARAVLGEAAAADSAAERFRLAHLAALRTAAAVFAERGRPVAARRRLVSAWVLVESVAPEFGEWAGYFAAGAPARAAVEAGAVSAVTARDADDQLRAAGEFLMLVEESLGMLVEDSLRLFATPLAS